MQEILIAHRANFPVAKKSGEAHWPELFLHMARVMTGRAKESRPAAIAAAKASPKHFTLFQIRARAPEKVRHVFRARGRVPTLKLHCLA